MKRVIHLIAMGDALQYSHHTLQSIVAYGVKCKADICITTSTQEDPPNWERLNILKRALNDSRWDQLLMMDIDIFVSPDAPSIFDEFPVGFHAAEDQVITWEDHDKFNLWLKTWGNFDNKTHFNGGVMLMDRPSLQALKPWLELPRINGPFYTADQHHENAAVYCTWPDFKTIPSTWNTPIPGKPGPMNLFLEPANFHHAHGIETAHGKELVLGQVSRQYQARFLKRMDELGSLLCVFRLIDQMGYHVGVIHTKWNEGPFGQFVSHYMNAKIFPCTPGILENVGPLLDFAFVDDLSTLPNVPWASEAMIVASDTPENESYITSKGWKYKKLASFFGLQAFVACVV
jgi:hypothetical protein